MGFFKSKSRRIVSALIISAAFVTASTAFAATGAGTEVYHKIVDLGNGLTYNNVVSENGNGRQESNFAELKPGTVKPVVIADDTIYGGLTIDKTTEFAEGLGHRILGGINTDFFSRQTGVPMGIAVEDGVYKSSPEGCNSICFDKDGNAKIVQDTAVQISLENLGGANGQYKNAGQGVNLTHFNKMRVNSAGLYLFDEYFSTVSTRTSGNGWYVKFKILEGSMKTKGSVTLQVAEKLRSSYPLDIGKGYMVLSAGDASKLDADYDKFDVGDVVKLETDTWGNQTVADSAWATGCGDIIVDNGQVADSSGWDKDLAAINPRSAMGIKADGTLVFYTLDGRQPGYSTGLTMTELAEEMINRGCVQAVNLDGGGSTVLSMLLPGQDKAAVTNSPSDGQERRSSTFAFFATGEEPDGIAKNLYLKDNGAVVFSGSSFDGAFQATDKANKPAELPSDTAASVVSGPASFENGRFTAGQGTGYVEVALNSESTGASGKSSFLVTDKITDIDVKCGPLDVTSGEIRLKKGEKTVLTPSDIYYGKPVINDKASYNWSAAGQGGTVDGQGSVIAGNKTGTADITVSSGRVSNTVKLIVEGAFTDTTLHWGDQFIQDLADKNIVSGIGDGLFGPDNGIKRGDFMLMLYRAAGKPAVTGASSFSDVHSSDYYADAVAWAASNKIAAGDGIHFMPQDTLTREQAFAFVYRYISGKGGAKTPSLSVLDQFSDVNAMESYAKLPAAALVSSDIVSGADGKIDPKGQLTRAQMSRILDSTLVYLDSLPPLENQEAQNEEQGTKQDENQAEPSKEDQKGSPDQPSDGDKTQPEEGNSDGSQAGIVDD